MIEHVIKDSITLAIIIRKNYSAEGIEFFTPIDFSQQLGYMKRPKGYIIEAHKHLKTSFYVNKLFETLFIKSGTVNVSLYDDKDIFFKNIILYKGDVVLFTGYGHKFEMIEESEIIEVKQGPYIEDKVKIDYL